MGAGLRGVWPEGAAGAGEHCCRCLWGRGQWGVGSQHCLSMSVQGLSCTAMAEAPSTSQRSTLIPSHPGKHHLCTLNFKQAAQVHAPGLDDY